MEQPTLPKLQAELMAAIPTLTLDDFAYHATDLYVVYTPEVWAWLQANHPIPANIRGFTSQAGSNWNGAGKRCLDIPFAGYWPSQAQVTGSGSY